MPGFVKTKKDEARWAKAKEAAGKSTQKDSDSYWALSNYIYHKMGKTEEDQQLAKALSLKLTAPKLSASAKPKGAPAAPKATLSTSVKTPKAAKPADPFDKASLLLKNEDSAGIKRSSVRKLRDFLEHKKKKR